MKIQAFESKSLLFQFGKNTTHIYNQIFFEH